MYLTIHPSIHSSMSVCLPACLSIYLSIYLSINPFYIYVHNSYVYKFVCTFICMCVRAFCLCKTLLIMYWLPSMRKKLIGARFKKKYCSTKPLSDAISNILKMIFNTAVFATKSSFI